MRKIHICILIFTFIAASALCFAQGHEQTIMTKERQLWKAFKNKDAKAFGQWIAEDAQDISAPDGRLRTKSEIIQMISEFDVAEYELTDMRVSNVIEDVAIVTYKAKTKGTHMGKPIPDVQYYASTVWVHKNGDWWARFHQESPIGPMSEMKQ